MVSVDVKLRDYYDLHSELGSCVKVEVDVQGSQSLTVLMVSAKLQALVYDILPWRKVPESDARSVGL